MKKWFKRQWLRIKGWAIGILVAIGLISVPIMGTAGAKDFSWTNPVENTDGSVFNPAVDQREARLYCTDTSDGSQVPVIVVPGAATAHTENFPTGEYQCYATVVSNEGAESFPSNTITFTVDPLIPNPPVLNP